MRALILNPPAEHTLPEYPDEEGNRFVETEDFGRFPPLGALYVLTYLTVHSPWHECYFKDCVGEGISHESLTQVIRKIRPDLVGITSFTISLVDVRKAAATVRRVLPETHICMGGHHPIAFPFEAAGLPEFDSIIVGEGEVAFHCLADRLSKGEDFSGIPGLYTSETIFHWKDKAIKDRRFLSNVMVPAGFIDDLGSLPVPDRRFIRHLRYHSILGVSSRLATLVSSRGCPYRCTYCDVPYKTYRERTVVDVVDEMEGCIEMGYDEFHFYDDLFNITPEKVIRFCDELERRCLSPRWDFRGRVNTVTKASLLRAVKAGCRMISFGVETGTDKGLQLLRKQTSTRQIRRVFTWCKEVGLKTVADFMIGLPFEKTADDVMRNIDFLLELQPDYAQISILTLYPNTKLFEAAREKGLVDMERWRLFLADPSPDFELDHWEEYLSIADLVKLQRKAYLRFYLRPSYIVKSVVNTATPYEFAAKLKGLVKLIRPR